MLYRFPTFQHEIIPYQSRSAVQYRHRINVKRHSKMCATHMSIRLTSYLIALLYENWIRKNDQNYVMTWIVAMCHRCFKRLPEKHPIWVYSHVLNLIVRTTQRELLNYTFWSIEKTNANEAVLLSNKYKSICYCYANHSGEIRLQTYIFSVFIRILLVIKILNMQKCRHLAFESLTHSFPLLSFF